MIDKQKYTFFPVGTVKPSGWLRRQLEIQAEGLGGKLHTFWPDIKESKWVGGDQEGWERVPYWLDGFIPLAYLLGDEKFIESARYYINYIINTQMEDGWIGPFGAPDERKQCDIWSHLLIAKVLSVYAEASDDPRIPEVMLRLFQAVDKHISVTPLFDWAQMRWYEGLIPIFWLYDRTGDSWLLDFATKLKVQGFDWRYFFENWPEKMKKPTPKKEWNQLGHVVNNAMAIKCAGLWSRISSDSSDAEFPQKMIEILDRYHGTVVGTFTGDECLAGTSPIQGTELCAVVEYMYSLEWLTAITGDAAYGDRLEKITYNALPATFLPDMWAHQYDQQVNQVQCSLEEEAPFRTNSPESHLFGLEPNFGCCTANMHQGWPKFAVTLVMASETGVAVTAYAPAKLDAVIAGKAFRLTIDTEYPFRNSIRITVGSKTESKISVDLRIPAWCKNPQVSLNGESLAVERGTYFSIKRVWSKGDEIKLHFPADFQLVNRPNGMVAVVQEPLVYALPIEEERREASEVRRRTSSHSADTNWELLPVSAWNYGIAKPGGGEWKAGEVTIRKPGSYPFSPKGAPVEVKVEVYPVVWSLDNGFCSETSGAVVAGAAGEEVILVPYGCTNLRLTEMPIVTKQGQNPNYKKMLR
ncbi:MAG: glycoside hydrolase family 127 protein [Bacteroidetes bacterium]|nr:glycoside hydrolase family 127 protein [Bacteroidota bacterium]